MLLFKRIIFVLFILFVFSSLTKNMLSYREKVAFYDSYKKDYEAEKKKNITLKTSILKKNDPNEIEKTIRNKLNLLKQNEVDVILPKPTATPALITPTLPPNWQQWYNTFFAN